MQDMTSRWILCWIHLFVYFSFFNSQELTTVQACDKIYMRIGITQHFKLSAKSYSAC